MDGSLKFLKNCCVKFIVVNCSLFSFIYNKKEN